MQKQEVAQVQALRSILLHITSQRKIFPVSNPVPKQHFLNWINNGITDALTRNYLRQIILVIYTNKSRPDMVVESYTFTITKKFTAKSLFNEDVLDVLDMLEPLPSTKYVSMRLIYNEKCPEDYEPEGFKKADNACIVKGKEVLVRQEIKIESEMKIKGDLVHKQPENVVEDKCRTAVQDKSVCETKHSSNVSKKTDKNVEIASKDVKTEQAKLSVNKQCDDIKEKMCQTSDTNCDQNVTSNKMCSETSKNKSATIKCVCGINHEDLDMLQCDKCNLWSHTVCCGFFSNNDKRIPQLYVCNICLNNNISRLALYRRALSVNYNEEILGITWLSKRLGISSRSANSIIKRLIHDGFIKTVSLNSKFKKYMAVKTDSVKEKVKKYFYVGRQKHSLPVKDISMGCHSVNKAVK